MLRWTLHKKIDQNPSNSSVLVRILVKELERVSAAPETLTEHCDGPLCGVGPAVGLGGAEGWGDPAAPTGLCLPPGASLQMAELVFLES